MTKKRMRKGYKKKVGKEMYYEKQSTIQIA
jgi:hypothetical protein